MQVCCLNLSDQSLNEQHSSCKLARFGTFKVGCAEFRTGRVGFQLRNTLLAWLRLRKMLLRQLAKVHSILIIYSFECFKILSTGCREKWARQSCTTPTATFNCLPYSRTESWQEMLPPILVAIFKWEYPQISTSSVAASFRQDIWITEVGMFSEFYCKSQSCRAQLSWKQSADSQSWKQLKGVQYFNCDVVSSYTILRRSCFVCSKHTYLCCRIWWTRMSMCNNSQQLLPHWRENSTSLAFLTCTTRQTSSAYLPTLAWHPISALNNWKQPPNNLTLRLVNLVLTWRHWMYNRWHTCPSCYWWRSESFLSPVLCHRILLSLLPVWLHTFKDQGTKISYCSACSFAEWYCNCTLHSRTTKSFIFETASLVPGQGAIVLSHVHNFAAASSACLRTSVRLQGKPLYWNEYGVGGGNNQNGAVKATTAEQAAANPYFGVFGSYSRATDPWVLYDLSQPSPVRDYLRYFYQQTVQYAEQTGVCF